MQSISLTLSFFTRIFNMMLLMEVQDVTRVHEVLDNVDHPSLGRVYLLYSDRVTDLSSATLDRLIFRPIDIV
jgi:hypothetical protein